MVVRTLASLVKPCKIVLSKIATQNASKRCTAALSPNWLISWDYSPIMVNSLCSHEAHIFMNRFTCAWHTAVVYTQHICVCGFASSRGLFHTFAHAINSCVYGCDDVVYSVGIIHNGFRFYRRSTYAHPYFYGSLVCATQHTRNKHGLLKYTNENKI